MSEIIYKVGGEIRVNTTPAGLVEDPSVAALPDGGWVVTWTSSGQDGSSAGIYQQRYDAEGRAVGTEAQVNTTAVYEQMEPAITALADGGWLITWASFSQDAPSTFGIYQQRYDSSGARQGGEVRVNGTTGSDQVTSAVTSLSDGGWLVTWQTNNQDGYGGWGIYQQRYDAQGNALGSEDRVNTTTLNDQQNAVVAALAGGGWVVTWESRDGSVLGIYQQRYAADGAAFGGEVLVNTTTYDDQRTPAVTALAGGGWVVTWESHGQDGSFGGIYQQRYDANGTAQGGEVRVNTTTDENQNRPAITALADGGWVVTWTALVERGVNAPNVYGIFQQRFSADGVAQNGEIEVSTTTYRQRVSAVTALADGGWVVTWEDDWGIYQQRFKVTDNGTFVGTAANDTLEATDGVDVMRGGLGDDTYHLGHIGAQVTEYSGEGTDTVYASLNIATLYENVENLVLVGSALRGRGNGSANSIMGNDLDNVLEGGAGDDTIDGGDGTNTAMFSGSSANYSISRTPDGDILIEGQDGVDVLWNIQFARFDDKTIDLRTLIGHNPPTDIRLTNSTVAELAGDGKQVGILSAIDPNAGEQFTYTLLDDASGRFAVSGDKLVVKNGVKLDYEQAISHQIKIQVKDSTGLVFDRVFTVDVVNVVNESATGTTGADVLKGDAGRDRFYGGAGNDTLWGGLSNDTLKGDAGKDVFVFDTKLNKRTNVDKILDFIVKDDSIWLDNAVFTKLGKVGTEAKPAQLNKAFFTIGAQAKDKNDYIVYDKAKGVLSYDADGSGKGKAVEIATLSKKLPMTHKDFFVI